MRTIVSAACWKRSEHAVLEAFGACAAVLLDVLVPDQVPCGRDPAAGPVLLGRERGERFAQVVGGQDAIGDLEKTGAGERVNGCPDGAVGTGVGSFVDGEVPGDGCGELAGGADRLEAWPADHDHSREQDELGEVLLCRLLRTARPE
ncbi:hypothetical protein ACFYYD_35535 [Streptomyces bluensis]|uniref:hypothetical protein n=1 Tax=Streptomyces bluensis TaxID=33897 RepID=UPI0036CB4587